jgi:hypothetical protein
MRQDNSLSTLPDRKLLVCIATIPTIDCVCNQLNNALRIGAGSLSLLQVMRGILLVIFVTIIALSIARKWSHLARIPVPAIGAVLVIGIATSKELLTTGGLSMISLGAYGQLLYWVLLWTTVSILCRQPGQAEIILRGLAWGALLTAVSVILGLFFGATNYYRADSVHSSAGWFDTAKMITGLLIVGGIVILYLGRERRRWLACLGAGLCFTACVLTYARAGSVALASVLLWFVTWRFVIARHCATKWLDGFLAVALASCIVVPAVADVPQLLSRWSDVGDADRGGSGRATFWKVAVDAYGSEQVPEQTLGIGYNSMSEMLLRNYGENIKHTHNDALDMLLVGGFVGPLWLLSLVWAFARRALLSPMHSVEGAAGVAIVLTYICHSQLTGQIWGTDAMTYYTMSLSCLTSMASPRTSVHTSEVSPAYRSALLA